MADEKKNEANKKTTKSTTAKKQTSKKNVKSQTKRPSPKQTTTSSKKQVKKIDKKPETKIPIVEEKKNKEVSKTIEKIIENKENVEKNIETKQEQLERTIIFDGAQKRNLQEVVEKLEKDNVVLRDKVVRRSKINKYIVITLMVLILAIMVYCAVYTTININNEIELSKPTETLNTNILSKVENNKKSETTEETKENTGEKEKENQKEDKETTQIVPITLEEFEEKVLNNEDMNVLVSSSVCYFCYTFEPIAEKVLTELDKKIYKIDIYNLSKEEIQKFREYYAFKMTPTIFTIEKGIVKKEKAGTQTEEEFKVWAEKNLL